MSVLVDISMKVKDEWKPWGIRPSRDIMKAVVAYWECPYCGNQEYNRRERAEGFTHYIVGFGMYNDETMFTFECPSCFKHSTLHAYLSSAKKIEEGFAKDPTYIRVEKARKQFKCMLEEMEK